jgi:PAS domain S-box-containing protein
MTSESSLTPSFALQEVHEESLFRRIIYALPEGIIALQANRDSEDQVADFDFILVNPAAQLIAGKSEEELKQLSLLKAFPQLKGEFFERYKKVIETGVSCAHDVLQQRNGANIYYNCQVSRFDDGLLISYKPIEAPIARPSIELYQERLLNSILNNLPVMVGRLDTEGKYLELRGEGLRVADIEDNELVGTSYVDHFPSLENPIKRVLDGESLNFISSLQHKGRDIFWLNYAYYDEALKCAVAFAIEITEQMEAQGRLKESQNFVEKITALTPGIITVFDCITGEYQYVNKAVEAMLGYSAEDWIQGGDAFLSSIVHPEDAGRIMAQNLAAIQTANESYPDYDDSKIIDFEYRIRHKNGEYLWVHTYGTIFDRTADGRLHHILNVSVDITERRKMEERLLATQQELKVLNAQLEEKVKERTSELISSQDKLKDAQRISGIGSWEYDFNTGSQTWSEEMYHIYGIDPVHGVPDTDTIRSMMPEWQSLEQKIDTARKNGLPYHIDTAVIINSNELKYLETIARPIFDEKGDLLRLHGTTMDITERKLAEIALQKSENQLRLLMNSIPAFVAYVNNELEYEYVNDQLLQFYNLRAEDIIGNNMQMLFSSSPHYAKTIEHISRALSGENVQFENRLVNSRNESIDVLVSYIPDINESNEVRGVIALQIDISAQKRFEEELEMRVQQRTQELYTTNAELNRSNQELEQFAYVASHDLKEPLRMVSNYTHLLQLRYQDKLDTEANEFIQFAMDGAKRMGFLINDLLEFSRIGKVYDNAETISVDSIIELIEKNLQEEMKSKNARIVVSDMPVLKVSPSYLLQLFQNLVSNGIKFNESPEPLIEITAKQLSGQWLFAVSDNGIGIDDDHANKIFIIFQRLHERNKYPGTGIGLSICKKIVEFYGGNIWVESQKGKGSTFYFTLPSVN